ncbi:MAG: hypothetical protein MJA29_09450 [Candidatus Omnitrophica bacterium]|nr:hypothetical protein [Candidatus Omnitrophota bacterium]
MIRLTGKSGICLCLLLLLCPGSLRAQDTLVVYYSRDGHTKKAADALAEKMDADTERLIDRKKRTGPIGTAAAGKDAVRGKMTVLDPLTHDPADYDIILIGTPSWFGNPTPAARTFVYNYDLTGKVVGVFSTAHLTGVEAALEKLSAQIDPSRDIPALPLRHSDLKDQTVFDARVEEFISKIKLDKKKE